MHVIFELTHFKENGIGVVIIIVSMKILKCILTSCIMHKIFQNQYFNQVFHSYSIIDQQSRINMWTKHFTNIPQIQHVCVETQRDLIMYVKYSQTLYTLSNKTEKEVSRNFLLEVAYQIQWNFIWKIKFEVWRIVHRLFSIFNWKIALKTINAEFHSNPLSKVKFPNFISQN